MMQCLPFTFHLNCENPSIIMSSLASITITLARPKTYLSSNYTFSQSIQLNFDQGIDFEYEMQSLLY